MTWLERFGDSVQTICPKCGEISSIDGKYDPICDYGTACGTPMIKTQFTYAQYYHLTQEQREKWNKHMREKYVINSPEFDEELYNTTMENDFERQMEFEADVQEDKNTGDNIPKCPTCGSPNIQKITGVERGASVFAWGLFSKKINKSFKCGNCGYSW
ncbi:MAG: hypothetical protein LBS36_03375 [Oscillospiraceae bacterium]|nr:hypothetical protein [Oscillospiraceae bacterium]